MRNNFSSDDHDPGDEDPTERVKRALLEVLDDPKAADAGVRNVFINLPGVTNAEIARAVEESDSRLRALWVTPGLRVDVLPPGGKR